MSSKQVIYYENLHCKVNFKYKTVLQDDFEVTDLKDIEREYNYCIGSDQYIKNFIEVMKERVIKKLPKLNKVKIILGIIDNNNIWHRLIITTVQMLHKILKIERKIDFYKSVFVIIKYENDIVFMGDLNFEGIE
jgi:predicted transcriptional regulator